MARRKTFKTFLWISSKNSASGRSFGSSTNEIQRPISTCEQRRFDIESCLFKKRKKRQSVTATLTLQEHEEQEHHFNMILNRHYPICSSQLVQFSVSEH